MALVYISSTYKDLRAERQAAYDAVRRLRHDARAMEDYVAADERPLEYCLADVRRSDIYIGILGWRYGWTPPGRSQSITELEYREAKKAKKKCLIFMQDDTLEPPASDPEDRRRIKRLRSDLSPKHLVGFFTSPEDLAAKVTASVANVFGELSEAIGKLDMPLQRVLDAVKQMANLPRLSSSEMAEEVDHLQRDAMNWVADGHYTRSAELRLIEARRLIAEAAEQGSEQQVLVTSRGYVEKTWAQVCEARGDSRAADAAYRAAARYFRAALKIDPTDVGALNGQANICIHQHEYEKAAKLGRVVTSYRPDYTAAYWDLAISLRALLKARPSRALIEELAEVCETLVRLVPSEPSGFTPADLAAVQNDARTYRRLAQQTSGSGAPVRAGRAAAIKQRVRKDQRREISRKRSRAARVTAGPRVRRIGPSG